MGVAICSDLVEEEVVVKDCDAFAHYTLSNLPHPQGGVEGCGIGQGVHPGSDWVGEGRNSIQWVPSHERYCRYI